LVVASKNPDKIAEIEAVLAEAGLAIEVVRGLVWPDVDEIGATLEENALLKARAVAAATGLAALADDTGLEVAALGGSPGVQTARFAGPNASYSDNVDKLLSDLSGFEERGATFRTVVALVVRGGGEVTAEGVLHGHIGHTIRGANGFGYDPIFEVAGRTLAEMTSDEKNRLSHRALAVKALLATLSN
jgi:XTP/dITP diphosphohydrolase